MLFFHFWLIERKLSRVQNKPNSTNNNGKETSNRAVAKEILKSLNLKRDAIFQQADSTTPTSDPTVDNDDDPSNPLQSISSLITNTALFGALEKKISPQTHAMDAEEVKKLLDADLLNLIRDLDATETAEGNASNEEENDNKTN